MKKPTMTGFVEFINEQDPDMTIDHSGLCGCAIGDYVKSVSGTRFNLSRNMALAKKLRTAKQIKYNKLREVLCTFPSWRAVPTYGHLQEFIANDYSLEGL